MCRCATLHRDVPACRADGCDGSVLEDHRDAPSAATSDQRHSDVLARRRTSGMPPDGYRSTSLHRCDYFKA
jgi:hypothetical protein